MVAGIGNIGVDQYGPVVFSKERTENMYNDGKISEKTYNKLMNQPITDAFVNSSLPEASSEVEPKKSLFQKFIDLFKIPKGQEKQAEMDAVTAQWAIDNTII